MKLPPFEYACPATLNEAIALLGDGDAKVIAGGQSLVPMMAFRVAAPSRLVDLRKLPDLKGVTIGSQGVTLGALTRWCEIEKNQDLSKAQPLLAAAIEHVAHYQVRNRGTVGGSMAHADPAAEMPGIAVTCEADISVVGANGARTIKARDFFVAALTTTLEADDIIVAVTLPAWPATRRWGFREFSRRRGDFALAAAAVFYDRDESGRAVNAHVGAIGIGDTPLRIAAAEAALNGRSVDEKTAQEAGKAAADAVSPRDDIHASAAYRKALLGTMVERAVLDSVSR